MNLCAEDVHVNDLVCTSAGPDRPSVWDRVVSIDRSPLTLRFADGSKSRIDPGVVCSVRRLVVLRGGKI